MSKAPTIFFVILLTAISLGFFYIISPFWVTIFLSFILAFLFNPVHSYFLSKTRPSLAAALSTLSIFITVILPISLVLYLVSVEANKNYSLLVDVINNNYGDILMKAMSIPIISNFMNNSNLLDSVQESLSIEKIVQYVNEALNYLFNLIKDSVLNIGNLLISFFLLLYLFYFICLEATKIKQSAYSFIPLKEEEKDHLTQECKKTISAVVYGIFLVGFLEGTYGMILFLILDIPSPVIWGVIMIVFSMLPILGTNTVLVPLLVYKFIVGDYLTGIAILIFGVGVVLVSQNVLKPKLVGDKSGMSPAIVAISSLGGLVVMGMEGILVGPLFATLFIVIWKEFRTKVNLEKLTK